MSRTNEERKLLQRLAGGELDGAVGNELVYAMNKRLYCGKYIKDGLPVLYRNRESIRFFNGKEKERIPGKYTEEWFDTDDRKLEFLRRYGWLTNDEEAKSYSAKFKPYRKIADKKGDKKMKEYGDVTYDENVDYNSLEQHTYEDAPGYVFYTCPNCGREYLATFILEENGDTMCIDCWSARNANDGEKGL